MPDTRVGLTAGIENPSALAAFDRREAAVVPRAVQEREPLIGEISIGYGVMADLGLLGGTGENCA